MAALNEPDDDLDLRRDSELLGREIAQMQAELEWVIQVAGLKNDPTLPLVKVLSTSLRLQWRLHHQAVRYFHDASDRLDREYHDTIKKTGLVIKQGEVALQARQAGIVEQLTPQLGSAVSHAVRQQVKIMKYRNFATWSIVVLAIALLPCAFTYAAGLTAGRFQGETTAHLIATAMQTGPAEALAWARLMQDNDATRAMAACHQSIQQDASGRHYRLMPVWTDPAATSAP